MRHISLRLSFRVFHSPRIWAVLILFCTGNAWAINEYYDLSRSVRALGMGGAFYGLSDDQSALFYNPAGLSRYEGNSQFKIQFQGDVATDVFSAASTLKNAGGQNLGQLIDDFVKYQGNPLYANATPLFIYYLHKHFATGLLIGDTKVDLALLGKDLNSMVDVTAISDSGYFVGYADEFFPHLHIGATGKLLFRAGGTKQFSILDIAENSKIVNNLKDLGGAGAGIDFDLGATYELPNIGPIEDSVSLVVSNLLATKYTLTQTDGTPPGLPRMVTLAGQARLPGVGIIHHIDAVLDLAEFEIGGQTNDNFGARYGAIWKHVNFGVEVPIGWFYLRGGIHQGDFTAGLGVDLNVIRLDVATYAEEDFLNPGEVTSRRVAASFAIGFGSAEPAVQSATRTEAPESQPTAPETAPTATPPPATTPTATPTATPTETSPAPATPTPAATETPATPTPTTTPPPTPEPAKSEPTPAPTQAPSAAPSATEAPKEDRPRAEEAAPADSPREPASDRFKVQEDPGPPGDR
jgi:hypothetical protein